MHRNSLRTIALKEYVSNITLAYLEASDEERHDGRLWYSTAHAFASGLAAEFNISVDYAAAYIAVLSPQIQWERNCIVAYEFCTGERPSAVLGDGLAKAWRMSTGGLIRDNVRGPKVTAFYHAIASAGARGIVIDRHSLSVALGRDCTLAERSAIGKEHIYDIIAKAYIRAARVLDVPVTVLQATTWLYWRNKEDNAPIE